MENVQKYNLTHPDFEGRIWENTNESINNLDDVDIVTEPDEVSLDPDFKRFLALGGLKK